MNVLTPIETGGTNGVPNYLWWCPGCEYAHGIWVTPQGDKPRWDWNGSLEKPTFSPSVLCQGTYRCHTFVRGGVIEYLADCNHHLAGQKVPMVPMPGAE